MNIEHGVAEVTHGADAITIMKSGPILVVVRRNLGDRSGRWRKTMEWWFGCRKMARQTAFWDDFLDHASQFGGRLRLPMRPRFLGDPGRRYRCPCDRDWCTPVRVGRVQRRGFPREAARSWRARPECGPSSKPNRCRVPRCWRGYGHVIVTLHRPALSWLGGSRAIQDPRGLPVDRSRCRLAVLSLVFR